MVPCAVKTNLFHLIRALLQVKKHLRSCNLSRTNVTEYDLILARAEKFNLSHEEVEKMVYTDGHVKAVSILAMKEKDWSSL